MRAWIAAAALLLAVQSPSALAGDTILVYTKNGKGFVHDNIAASTQAVRELAEAEGIAVEASNDPAVFTDESLKRFRALVFCNSNNEAFDTEEQKQAFQRYIRGGGGFAGIHSATGSERKWEWYRDLIGGKFSWHTPLQPFSIKVADAAHPSTANLPNPWAWEDEFYFMESLGKDLHVLLAGDLASLKKLDEKARERLKPYGETYPLSWCHEFEGGRSWYTALGHKPAYYSDPVFRKHLIGGILWAMGRASPGEKTTAEAKRE
jgi:uncharacterized protein